MTASVTIKFTVPTGEKHLAHMRKAAGFLTDSQSSVEILQSVDDPKALTARFSVPDARQADIVDNIGRGFWNFLEDYSHCSIGFSSESQRRRSANRRRRTKGC